MWLETFPAYLSEFRVENVDKLTGSGQIIRNDEKWPHLDFIRGSKKNFLVIKCVLPSRKYMKTAKIITVLSHRYPGERLRSHFALFDNHILNFAHQKAESKPFYV